MKFLKSIPVCIGLLGLLPGCNAPVTQFELMHPDFTNVTFNNQIVESDSLNVLLFEYIYNGAGVGVGDFNNDGWTDIFLGGNMVTSRLYLNRGDFKFEDVTVPAGVQTSLWCTGISLVDINQDSYTDIYVSTVHPDKDKTSPNLLFLNKGPNDKGIPVFEEAAMQAGVADRSYSTQAAFLDYDKDGDLDMYLMNNALENYTRNTPIGQRSDGHGKSLDKLYRLDTVREGIPLFTDVSREAGILDEGWGLGIVVNDINGDGYPDVYLANDFLSNDLLYINNRNGTFTNQAKNFLKHQEYNGMGVDMGDINNDGLNDIVAVDMMPDDNLRQKTMFSGIGYDRFLKNIQMNYQPQYVRNVLQLNNGNNSFSDIGYMAGIHATDWSWSTLIADFNNDALQDVLITNGYRKDVTDLDFVTYSKEAGMFGTEGARLKKAMEAVNELEGVKKANFIYKNEGQLRFSNVAAGWGIDQPSYSNGAAYADFDNDGDLDMVMNNINDEAFLYRNNNPGKHHFLRIRLIGNKGNSEALGTKIEIRYNSTKQYREHQLHRGYQSTVEPFVHFGVSGARLIDTLRVVWPNGKAETLTGVKTDQVLTLSEADATENKTDTPVSNPVFKEISKQYQLSFVHTEDDYVDYKATPTLPHKHSQNGPGIAVGDLNGDKWDDFFVGGSSRRNGMLFFQTARHTFEMAPLGDPAQPKVMEDMGVLLFDADGDGDLDLYCVSGSSELDTTNANYQDRLYTNDGKGHFDVASSALPSDGISGSSVVAHDYDKDGDLDLFVAGRIRPKKYPLPPKSRLLRNDGGTFTDVTGTLAPAWTKLGLVTAALWSDVDNDGWTDLVIVGEFMPVTIFKNESGKSFNKLNVPSLDRAVGWWNSLASADFDNDGDPDYVIGNLGLNSRLQASEKLPVCIHAKDFDGNRSFDPILCTFVSEDQEYPIHMRETLTDQVAGLRFSLKSYAQYGKMTFSDIFPEEKTKGAYVVKATYFSTAYLENKGTGEFKLRPLPAACQRSPQYGMVPTDVNGDGNQDLLMVGNFLGSETLSGWYDAGIGNCLLGDGKGQFRALDVATSGFLVTSDAKGLAEINLGQEAGWLVTSNRDSLKLFGYRVPKKSNVIALQPDDAFAEITYKDGRRRKQEFFYGDSYLSQSSRSWRPDGEIQEIRITSMTGVSRKVF